MSFSDEFLKEEEIILNSIKKYQEMIREQRDKLNILFDWLEEAKTQKKHIHIYGKGRSGTAAAALALRLHQFGYPVSFIDDLIKKRIHKGDVVILFSGSGETSEVVDVSKRAKKEKAKVVGITSYKDSNLARYSNLVIFIPGGMEKKKGWDYLEAQLSKNTEIYGGGEFELAAYLFQETFVNALGKYKGIPGGVVAKSHERDEVLE